MGNIKKFNHFNDLPFTLGELPSSYLISLSYEEQLLCLGKKIEEIINYIDTLLNDKISEHIEKIFNDIMINYMYDAETETLILYSEREGE